MFRTALIAAVMAATSLVVVPPASAAEELSQAKARKMVDSGAAAVAAGRNLKNAAIRSALIGRTFFMRSYAPSATVVIQFYSEDYIVTPGGVRGSWSVRSNKFCYREATMTAPRCAIKVAKLSSGLAFIDAKGKPDSLALVPKIKR